MNKRPPAWLLPNLMSLDAPLVALVWMWMLARVMRVQHIEASSYLVLAGGVWCVYVLDRIRDVRSGKHPIADEMPWRHHFHWRYKGVLLTAVAVVVAVCAYISLFVLSREMLVLGLAALFLVFCYWFISRFDRGEVAYAKNMVAGLTFAFGVAGPSVISSEPLPFVLDDVFRPFSVVYDSGGGVGYLTACFDALKVFVVMVLAALQVVLMSTHVLLFALLFVMNINAIDLWEYSRRSDDPLVKQESELSLSIGLITLVAGAVFAAAYVVDEYSLPLCYAVMVSAGLLQVINKIRGRFSIDALRVMADLALVVPIPVAAWLA